MIPSEVASERTVIISEREGSENEPMFLLNEAVQAAAFSVHPYHHQVIGDKADLQTISRDDLYNHYRNHYSPNNAVLALAGDFNSQNHACPNLGTFESIPTGKDVSRLDRSEPETGENTVWMFMDQEKPPF